MLLFAGAVLVADPWHGGPQKSAGGGGDSSGGDASAFKGLAAVLSAAVLSAASSVYFEMMLKKPPRSKEAASVGLWLRNVQLGIFATPLAALAMYVNDGEFVVAYGVLQGFDVLVWLIVLLNGLGGLLVAATMKYADNIAKCFAASLAIVSGTVLSVPIFGFALSGSFGIGALCTIVASTLYSLAPDTCGGEDSNSARGDAAPVHAEELLLLRNRGKRNSSDSGGDDDV